MWTQSLNTGVIHHKRLEPVNHDLTFKYWGLVLPLQSGEPIQLPLWARFMGTRVRDKDHGARDGSNLFDFAQAQWRQAGINIDRNSHVFLTCFPRQFGFDFNPLSVYWAWEDQTLKAVLFEVRNTVGGIHHYAFCPEMDGRQPTHAEKVFYVSPFIPNASDYRFTLSATQSDFQIGIDVLAADQSSVIMKASQTGTLHPYSAKALCKFILRRPAQSWSVMRDILWHALCLKLKGAPYHSPQSASYAQRRSHRDESVVSPAE